MENFEKRIPQIDNKTIEKNVDDFMDKHKDLRNLDNDDSLKKSIYNTL